MNIVVKPKYKDDTVLDVLRRRKIYITADCGGRGICGKCRVKFFDPESRPEPTESDSAVFTDLELKDGFRLACTAKLKSEAEIMIPDQSMIPEIEEIEPEVFPPSPSEIISVDFGTTMIAGALVDLNEGVVREARVINHQKAYGADVLSRIRVAENGYGEELRLIASDDLAQLGIKLGRDPDKVRYIISANTAMQHIISGFSVKGLGAYPYEPVDISMRRDGNLVMLPGVSAFVGADIVSGICASSLDKAEKPWIYVDIGTNGEMAIGSGSDILVASAPAGPAFEGAGIRHGMPAVEGAISGVSIAGREVVVDTVGGAEAVGICGSGAIEAVAELRKNGIIDASGSMEEEYAGSDDGDGYPLTKDITFLEKDVRELQKAKAAIRAGLEILIKESGLRRSEIDKFVVAGDFGEKLDIEKAAGIDLIPEEFIEITCTSGNASLAGAILYALDTGFGERLKSVAEHAREITLTDDERFQNEYINRMNFD